MKSVPLQFVGERQVQPVCSIRIGIKRHAIRIAQPSKIGDHPGDLAGFRIKAIQNIYAAQGIIREVVHIGHENSSIWRLGHEAYAFQSFSGDGYFESLGKV